jgi:hypothetical protein
MVSEHTGHVPEMRRKGYTLIALNAQHIAICIEAIRMAFAPDSICVEKIEMVAGDIANLDLTWAITMETIALVAKDIALRWDDSCIARPRDFVTSRGHTRHRRVGAQCGACDASTTSMGRVAWRHVHKAYKSCTCVRTNEHRHHVVILAAPQLRMVADERWNVVQTRCRAQETPEKKGGRPAIYLRFGRIS